MAKIEMDLSEYEKMMENKKLLEKSLENERLLQGQIKTLNEEKIKAYEDAKMKVVKTTYINTTETKYMVRSPKDLAKELRYLYNYLSVDNRYDYSIFEHESDRIIKSFFETIRSNGITHDETTFHGLDDIKLEIRKELEDNMDQSIKNKIAAADLANKKFDELVNEKNKLDKNLSIAREMMDSVIKDNDRLTEENKKLEEAKESLLKDIQAISNIREIMKGGYTMFNKSVLLDQIIEQIKIK